MSSTQASAAQKDRRLRVFLCHASGDKPAVRDLYRRLKADGFAPWLDEEDLLPGQYWRDEIPAAVRSCDIVVVCLSRQSVTKEGYLQKEVRYALDVADEKPEGTIFIIPAKLEPVEVPQRLAQWQWANLFQNDGYDKLVRALSLRAKDVGVTIPPALNLTATAPMNLTAAEMSATGDRHFRARDYGQARDWFEKAAAAGSSDAMSNLGFIYDHGLGVTQDYMQARLWYEKGAAAGSASAMNNLGWLYNQGHGVGQNNRLAREWYEKAAARGNPVAMYNLGMLYRADHNHEQARMWFEKAKAAGHPDAEKRLQELPE
jgi:Flp pilus assembly protein TadD